MNRIVLLGENIAHSRSPLILNTLFRRYDLPYHYALEPLEGELVAAAIERMKAGGYRGANITSPHKERAAEAVDTLSDEAGRIGAINTIVFESGRAIGHNTDIDGFFSTLQSDPLLHSSFSAAILGTGGAARAAVVALLGASTLREITIYSRLESRAIEIAARFDDSRVIGCALDRFIAAGLLVQATPVGLPGREGTLLDEKQLEGVALFYEMIYSPPETEQLRIARQSGARTINGERMLVAQALRSFELWTGIRASESDLPDDIFSIDLSAAP